eukprot:TRINITY_DN27603_c0_g1_i1.p1 TRINITY_DN27603_c0_g1~~TRINITY_DN27603_c0_g1_i1.p1  ORF type:complete len:462 (-),score=64.85 TRINITY_DN27603_c0_g1_i1:46-1431(-)
MPVSTSTQIAVVAGFLSVAVGISLYSLSVTTIHLSLTLTAGVFAWVLIPSSFELFTKANLVGRDLNKVAKNPVPESLGVIASAVFLICMFLFLPIPFYSSLSQIPFSPFSPFHSSSNSSSSPSSLSSYQHHPNLPHLFSQFPHFRLTEFISALLSICCMIFLGLADDVLNLRWRHKLLLPTLASLPLLLVYFLNISSTSILLPSPLSSLFSTPYLDLGIFFYIYMSSLAVFCTNAINILAGINGVEVGQSVIIGLSILLNNVIQIFYGVPEVRDNHVFSVWFILPFLAVSIALLYWNFYPSECFVGDTYCYFAGMTFAVVGILGHFSKTLLLFFLPQIFNFLYSCPQLFKVIPCPRHRMPKLDEKTGKLGMSMCEFEEKEVGRVGKMMVGMMERFGLAYVERSKGGKVKMSNMTIINFVLLKGGNAGERELMLRVMAIQVLCSVFAFILRYLVASLFYKNI